MYCFSKLIRRNRALALAVVAMLILLIGGTVVSTLFAIQARHQARNAGEIYSFFDENLLNSLNPLKSNADKVTASAILNKASEIKSEKGWLRLVM